MVERNQFQSIRIHVESVDHAVIADSELEGRNALEPLVTKVPKMCSEKINPGFQLSLSVPGQTKETPVELRRTHLLGREWHRASRFRLANTHAALSDVAHPAFDARLELIGKFQLVLNEIIEGIAHFD